MGFGRIWLPTPVVPGRGVICIGRPGVDNALALLIGHEIYLCSRECRHRNVINFLSSEETGNVIDHFAQFGSVGISRA